MSAEAEWEAASAVWDDLERQLDTPAQPAEPAMQACPIRVRKRPASTSPLFFDAQLAEAALALKAEALEQRQEQREQRGAEMNTVGGRWANLRDDALAEAERQQEERQQQEPLRDEALAEAERQQAEEEARKQRRRERKKQRKKQRQAEEAKAEAEAARPAGVSTRRNPHHNLNPCKIHHFYAKSVSFHTKFISFHTHVHGMCTCSLVVAGVGLRLGGTSGYSRRYHLEAIPGAACGIGSDSR